VKHALTFLGLIISAGILFVGSTFFQKPTLPSQSPKKILSIALSPVPTNSTLTQAIFIPYWTLSQKKIDSSAYDSVIYFGITANANGIVSTESGYKDISLFKNSISSPHKKLLTVTLTDSQFNSSLLENKSFEQTIATQSANIAKENGFDGIVLDFEINALSFPSVVNSITQFASTFSGVAKGNGLSFYMTSFGDTFYRLRPYDEGALAKISDGIMVMAYDFHKANGDPGPNFPYGGDEYNFQKMVADFTKVIPKDKLTIIFGMFGYDWTIDDKGRSTGPAQALTTNEIEQKFANKIVTDPISLEKKISYTDGVGKSHVVWFEDMSSAQKKIDYLKTQGISSVSFWAWSYY